MGSALCALLALGACNERALQTGSDAGATPGGLTPEQAAAVVVRVGDKVITLGDFAATLERLNQYDRLKYVTSDQRRKLLDEIVNDELLAQEARRRGLDKQEQVQAELQQILRDAMLEKIAEAAPYSAITNDEVRDYYDKHKDRFEEPERRRVSAIVLSSKTDAEKVLAEAKQLKSDAEWGELFYKHSITAPSKRDPAEPADLAGSLDIVGPPGDARGASGKVPEAVRKAVFAVTDVGQVYDELVDADGKLYVVRLTGRTTGHSRSLSEADRSIRLLLATEKRKQREVETVAELRKKFGVQIDEKALGEVRMPDGFDQVKVPWDVDGGAPAPGSSAVPSAEHVIRP